MNNLRALVETKKRLNRKTPFIEWQFILMKHNLHQVQEAERMAKSIGVDSLRFIPVGIPFGEEDKAVLKREWFPELGDFSASAEKSDHQFLQSPRKSACFYLYRSIAVNSDGKVSPCCYVYGQQNDFGDFLTQNPRNIWNNEHYQSARSLFSGNGKASIQTVCEQCNVFERTDLLK
jgi:radical SAM protein with 4Fe4S-binding SPASM domain